MMTEMVSASQNYVDDIYDKKSPWAMDQPCFPIGPTVSILNFEIQVMSLYISFSMALRNFYTKG